MSYSIARQGSTQEDFKVHREGIVVWPKHPHQSLLTSILPHQRKISDEGMLDRHAFQCLAIAGENTV